MNATTKKQNQAERNKAMTATEAKELLPSIKKMLVSKTGVAYGWGSAPWKWVSGLTAEERAHVRNDTAIVVITGCPPAGGNHGSTERMVVYYRGRYTHRLMPSEHPAGTLLVRPQAAAPC